MKLLSCSRLGLVCASLVWTLAGPMNLVATPLLFTNTFGSVNYPPGGAPFDVVSWLNSGTFSVYTTNNTVIGGGTSTNGSQGILADPIPFTATSLQSFTNRAIMYGQPGYRFLTISPQGSGSITNETQQAMRHFENSGIIAASTRLSVFAAEIIVNNLLACNEQGFILLYATNTVTNLVGQANLQGAGLYAGPMDQINPILASSGFGRNSAGGTNGGSTNVTVAGYTNGSYITDAYWAAGANNRMGTTNAPAIFGTNLTNLSHAQSPFHTTAAPLTSFPYQFTNNNTRIPSCGPSDLRYFQAFVNTNLINASNQVVQVVMVATNPAYPNLGVNVGFIAPMILTTNTTNLTVSGIGYTSVVQFAWLDTNIVTDQVITNPLYFIDSSLVAPATLLANLQPLSSQPAATKRPLAFELTPTVPSEWTNLTVPNAPINLAPFDPMFFDPDRISLGAGSVLNRTTNLFNVQYAAYSANLGVTTRSGNAAPRLNPIINDPTNMAGRVEVRAQRLNMLNARVRAETFISIQTPNLEGDAMPQLDAPILDLNIGSTNRLLVFSNTIPKITGRLSGQLSAYSAVWTNVVQVLGPNPTNPAILVTNLQATLFHVLVLDNCLKPAEVLVNRLAIHATNLVMADPMTVASSLLLDVRSLTIGPDASLTLPPGWGWGSSNVPGLVSLTNSGPIVVPGSAAFVNGTNACTNFVNHGSVSADSLTIAARYFENSGIYANKDRALLAAVNSPFLVNAQTATFTNGLLTNRFDVEIHAQTLDMDSTIVSAGMTNGGQGFAVLGKLVLSVTNRLNDGSAFDGNNFTWRLANNEWRVVGGLDVQSGVGTNHRPNVLTGNLLGTTIRSALPSGFNAEHVWPARDMGATVAAYTNNLAVGKLVLDGKRNNMFIFRGPDETNAYALYVDYLDLVGDTTNYYRTLSIPGTNFTLYFANASVPPYKLDGAANGRVVWVHDSFSGQFNYVGPYSSTLFTNSYGGVPFIAGLNTALVSDCDYDSNYDGTNNCMDANWPLFTPKDVNLQISIGGVPPAQFSLLTWTALACSTNVLEVTTSTNLAAPVWTALTNFVQGPVTGSCTVRDPVVAPQRQYRVRENPQWPPQ